MADRRWFLAGVLVVVAISGATAWGPPPALQGGAPAVAAQGGGGQGPGAPGRGGRGGRGTAFTPAAGAKDLKSVLYNWTWHMGMLRSGNESELVKTLEYEAEGSTILMDGQ